MSIDFAALTQAVVAGLSDVRSCLIVSRDGLALGASPAIEEGRTLDVWTRVASLGEVERGFVTVRDEVWVFCRRGAYAAVATAGSTARPGLILDSLEQMVLAAEEARVRKEGLRLAAELETISADTPRGLRTSLHKERTPSGSPSDAGPSLEAQEAAVSAWARRLGARSDERKQSASVPVSAWAAQEARSPRPSEPPPAPVSEVSANAQPAVATPEAGTESRERAPDDSSVDPVELSREFAAILAEQEEGPQ